jgi:hypothetical protein
VPDPIEAKVELRSTVGELEATTEASSDEVSGFALDDFGAQGSSAIMSAASQHLKNFGVSPDSYWNLAFGLTS